MNGEISLQFQQTLNTLIETLIKPETLKRDLFFALLVIVISENDFVLKGNKEINVVDYILSKRLKNDNIYEVTVILNAFQDTPAKIIASSLADVILINAIIPNINTDVYSLCLVINEFVLTNTLGIPLRFCNLNQLFLNLMNNIIVPVKSSILNHYSQPSCSLRGLPNDVMYQILDKLPINDILNLSETCAKLRNVIDSENLWSRLCRRDFSIQIKDDNLIGKNVYKTMYLKQHRNIIEPIYGMIVEEDEIAEWDEYMTPVRDSQWNVIF